MDLLSTASSSGNGERTRPTRPDVSISVLSNSSASLNEIQRPTTGTVPSPTPSSTAEEVPPATATEANHRVVPAELPADASNNESGVESDAECGLEERLANTHLTEDTAEAGNIVKGKGMQAEVCWHRSASFFQSSTWS